MQLRLIASLIIGLAGSPGYAADKNLPAQDRTMIVEMQEKMAKLHSNAAECLKSEKTVDSCKSEMMTECSMGKSHCQMMSNMMSGDMMMNGHGIDKMKPKKK